MPRSSTAGPATAATAGFLVSRPSSRAAAARVSRRRACRDGRQLIRTSWAGPADDGPRLAAAAPSFWVIMVSGRLFPVEQRWRPFEESREYGLNEAIVDAVDELWRGGPGDVLVFLPVQANDYSLSNVYRLIIHYEAP